MMLEEYLKQEQSIRYGVHFKGGIWWQRTSLGRSRPLHLLQMVVPGAARPEYLKSFLGYWHLVPSNAATNSERLLMMLSDERLNSFCFEGLPHEKRKAINRASKRGLVVKKILSLEDHWKSLQSIFISTAQRTKHGVPAEYYADKTEEWKRGLRRHFSLPGRDWFGVWFGEELVGYLYSCLIEDQAFLMITKFNSDYIEARPSDALHYYALSYYRDHPDCHTVTAGTANLMVPSIDRFKKSFGFEEVHYPAYSRTNYLVKKAIQGAFACAAIAVKWQSADSKRNLRYNVELLKRVSSNW